MLRFSSVWTQPVIGMFAEPWIFPMKLVRFLFIYFQREGKGGRKILMQERNIDWLPLPSTWTGTKHTTKACALTGNRTSNLLLCGTKPNQLSHTGQGPVKLNSTFTWWWLIFWCWGNSSLHCRVEDKDSCISSLLFISKVLTKAYILWNKLIRRENIHLDKGSQYTHTCWLTCYLGKFFLGFK